MCWRIGSCTRDGGEGLGEDGIDFCELIEDWDFEAELAGTLFFFVACALTELKKESTFELSCSGSFFLAGTGGDGGVMTGLAFFSATEMS